MNQTIPPAARFSLRVAGRSLERFARRFKSFFIPSQIYTYFKIVRRHKLQPGDAGRRIVLFDFTQVAIEADGGRYGVLLVREFETLGFLVSFRWNYSFLATMQHKHCKRLLLARDFRVHRSADELLKYPPAIVVSDRVEFSDDSAGRQIRVRYGAVLPQQPSEVQMPFLVYPKNYDRCLTLSAPDPQGERAWRIFFGGSIGSRYDGNALPQNFGKMSRMAMLNALQAHLPPDRVRSIQDATDWQRVDAQPGLVLAVNQVSDPIVPYAAWFEVLERADFFLACPGVEMPMCHNVIEALARGTVPILEHPEFFDPPLEHNVNCLVFNGREELLRLCEQVFRMPPQQIQRLRQGAYAYYQNNLAPGKFAQRVLDLPDDRVDILLNACQTPRPPAKMPSPPALR